MPVQGWWIKSGGPSLVCPWTKSGVLPAVLSELLPSARDLCQQCQQPWMAPRRSCMSACALPDACPRPSGYVACMCLNVTSSSAAKFFGFKKCWPCFTVFWLEHLVSPIGYMPQTLMRNAGA